VVDSTGREVGILREVLQPGANDVYVIDLKEGGYMMLPALLKAIPRVSVEERLITINEEILDEVAVIEH
ncbi:MAG: 16S rRNA processing protein RimM, partial [Eubacteriales bacterium]